MLTFAQKTLTAVIWNFTGVLGNQLLQFLTTLVLARLLSPAEFGLVALMVVFTHLAATFVESGYGASLIQMQTVPRELASSVFYFNLAMALVLYGVFWYAAVPIAHFYREPLLVPIARVLALTVIFNALGLVQNCLLARQLNFRTQSKATVLATAVAGTIGIALALRGYGVWSLVVQSLCSTGLRALLLWGFSPWRPAWTFSAAAMRAMFPYGSRLLLSGLLGTLYESLIPLFIGKLFPKVELGYYSRAQGTQRLASGSFTTIIIDVIFPAYAAIQDDRVLLRDGYRKTILYTSVVLLPLMFGLAAIAHPLFLVLFTAKWLPSVPYFQVLCFSGALYHLHALNLNVLKATGRSDLYLRLTLIKLVLLVTGAAIAWRFGMMGIVLGQVAVSWLCLGVNTYYTKLLLNYSLRHQIADIGPYFAISLAAAASTYYLGGRIAHLDALLQVALLSLAMLFLFFGLVTLLRLRAPAQLLGRLKAHARGGVRPFIPAE
jgi:teichuronic acid exporter